MDKKNFSFYMPEDLDHKIDYLRDSNEKLKGLSKSQSIYFLISELYNKAVHADISKENKEE